MTDINMERYRAQIPNQLYALGDGDENRFLHFEWFQMPDAQNLFTRLQVYARKALDRSDKHGNGGNVAKRELEKAMMRSRLEIVSDLLQNDERTSEAVEGIINEIQERGIYKIGKTIVFSYVQYAEDSVNITTSEEYRSAREGEMVMIENHIFIHLDGDELPDLDTLLTLVRQVTLKSDMIDACERYDPAKIEQDIKDFYANSDIDLGLLADVSNMVIHGLLINILQELNERIISEEETDG